MSDARRRQWLAAALGAILLGGIGVATVMWVRRELAIDACLDQGGRWDAADQCQHEPVSSPS